MIKKGGIVPINKNLWSISYIFLTAGLAFWLFSFCYYLIDVRKSWDGWPFIYIGMNSIAIYLSHECFNLYFPFSYKNNGSHFSMLLSNILGVLSWLLAAYFLFINKIFIKV
jgi:heparan-alpha-glucosaminide N-acetyltransferase